MYRTNEFRSVLLTYTCHFQVNAVFRLIVSITKFSIVIGSLGASLSRNQRVITWVSNYRCSNKVAEHSFQLPMPNSPLLFNYSRFGARFLQESRLNTEVFILAFWLGCVLLPWQRGWLKAKLKKRFSFI